MTAGHRGVLGMAEEETEVGRAGRGGRGVVAEASEEAVVAGGGSGAVGERQGVAALLGKVTWLVCIREVFTAFMDRSTRAHKGGVLR